MAVVADVLIAVVVQAVAMLANLAVAVVVALQTKRQQANVPAMTAVIKASQMNVQVASHTKGNVLVLTVVIVQLLAVVVLAVVKVVRQIAQTVAQMAAIAVATRNN